MRCLGARIAAIWLGLLLPLSAAATQLGDIQIHSLVGQPFFATISAELDASESIDRMRPTIASAATYEAFGIRYDAYVRAIDITTREEDGQLRFDLRGRRTLREFHLDLIFELRLPTGTVMRAYTVLPELDLQPAARDARRVARPPSRPPAVPSRLTAPVAATSQRPNATRPYTLAQGDTLMSIARRMEPELGSVRRRHALIRAANPQLSMGSGVLRPGMTLQLPSLGASPTASSAVLPVAALEGTGSAVRTPSVAAITTPGLAAESAVGSATARAPDLSPEDAARAGVVQRARGRAIVRLAAVEGVEFRQQQDGSTELVTSGADERDAAALEQVRRNLEQLAQAPSSAAVVDADDVVQSERAQVPVPAAADATPAAAASLEARGGQDSTIMSRVGLILGLLALIGVGALVVRRIRGQRAGLQETGIAAAASLSSTQELPAVALEAEDSIGPDGAAAGAIDDVTQVRAGTRSDERVPRPQEKSNEQPGIEELTLDTLSIDLDVDGIDLGGFKREDLGAGVTDALQHDPAAKDFELDAATPHDDEAPADVEVDLAGLEFGPERATNPASPADASEPIADFELDVDDMLLEMDGADPGADPVAELASEQEPEVAEGPAAPSADAVETDLPDLEIDLDGADQSEAPVGPGAECVEDGASEAEEADLDVVLLDLDSDLEIDPDGADDIVDASAGTEATQAAQATQALDSADAAESDFDVGALDMDVLEPEPEVPAPASTRPAGAATAEQGTTAVFEASELSQPPAMEPEVLTVTRTMPHRSAETVARVSLEALDGSLRVATHSDGALLYIELDDMEGVEQRYGAAAVERCVTDAHTVLTATRGGRGGAFHRVDDHGFVTLVLQDSLRDWIASSEELVWAIREHYVLVEGGAVRFNACIAIVPLDDAIADVADYMQRATATLAALRADPSNKNGVAVHDISLLQSA